MAVARSHRLPLRRIAGIPGVGARGPSGRALVRTRAANNDDDSYSELERITHGTVAYDATTHRVSVVDRANAGEGVVAAIAATVVATGIALGLGARRSHRWSMWNTKGDGEGSANVEGGQEQQSAPAAASASTRRLSNDESPSGTRSVALSRTRRVLGVSANDDNDDDEDDDHEKKDDEEEKGEDHPLSPASRTSEDGDEQDSSPSLEDRRSAYSKYLRFLKRGRVTLPSLVDLHESTFGRDRYLRSLEADDERLR